MSETYTAETMLAKEAEIKQAEEKLAELDHNTHIAGSHEYYEQIRRWSDQRQIVKKLRAELDHMRLFGPFPSDVMEAYWRLKDLSKQEGFTAKLPVWNLMRAIGKAIGDPDWPERG